MKPRVCYIRDLRGFQNFDPTSSANIRLVIPNQAVFGVHFGGVWSDVGPHCCGYISCLGDVHLRIYPPLQLTANASETGWLEFVIISFGDGRGWPISRGFNRCLFQGVPPFSHVITCHLLSFHVPSGYTLEN